MFGVAKSNPTLPWPLAKNQKRQRNTQKKKKFTVQGPERKKKGNQKWTQMKWKSWKLKRKRDNENVIKGDPMKAILEWYFHAGI